MKPIKDSFAKLTKDIAHTKDSRLCKIYNNWHYFCSEDESKILSPYKLQGREPRLKLIVISRQELDIFSKNNLKENLKSNINSFFGKEFISEVKITFLE